MAIMVTDVELQRQLIVLQTYFNASSTLKLYKNDYTPDPDSGAGNFTEANFPGYSSEALSGTWGAPVEAANGSWYIEADAVTFTRTGAGADNTIYGYWVETGIGVSFAERFAQPIIVDADALPFRLTIKFTEKAEAAV